MSHQLTVKEIDSDLNQTVQLAASAHKKGTKTLSYHLKTGKFILIIYQYGNPPAETRTEYVHVAVGLYNNAG
jgi:hypothetical protein